MEACTAKYYPISVLQPTHKLLGFLQAANDDSYTPQRYPHAYLSNGLADVSKRQTRCSCYLQDGERRSEPPSAAPYTIVGPQVHFPSP
jgi:hypothetical protein